MSMSDYRVPTKDATEDNKLGWFREVLQTGEAYLKTQTAYNDIDRALEILSGVSDERLPKYLSRVRVNRIRRQVREIIAMLSNLRPAWSYKVDNPPFEKHNVILCNLLTAWYHGMFADQAIKDVLAWGAVGGTGYLSPQFVRDYWTYGRGDIKPFVLGPRDVIPFGIGRDFDLQRAYMVALKSEVPLHMAHAMFPEFQDRIKAQRDSPSWMGKAFEKFKQIVKGGALAVSPRGSGEPSNIPVPTVDVYDAYIMDSSINVTTQVIQMGEPGSSWAYSVPPLGSDIPTGFKDNQGRELLRKAMPEDCRLYPLRRRMTVVNECLVYDDTNQSWHGKVPAIPFSLDVWPWEFLGYPLTRDNDSIQQSIIEVLRSIEQKVRLGLDPPTQYDSQITPKATMQNIDLRRPGTKIPGNFSMGEPIKAVLGPEYYHVASEAFKYVESMEARMDHQMGVQDVTAIAKARQIPSSDSIEKILEMAGPLVMGMSRSMERSIRELGEQMKSNFFQFYTVPRRLQIMGEKGLVDEDYDYDPMNMIPSHLPGEDTTVPSRSTMLDRARWHQNNFIFHVTPHSLHQITQLSTKLMYMQLFAKGFPIDPWTVAEAMDIPNFGSPPPECITVMDKWGYWKGTQAAMAQEGLAAQQKAQGRPPSGQAAPQIKSKEGGARQTVTESR